MKHNKIMNNIEINLNEIQPILVTDENPLSIVSTGIYGDINRNITETELIHKTGKRFMFIYPILEDTHYSDILKKIHNSETIIKIDDKDYKIRPATVEEVVIYTINFKEKVIDKKLLILGEEILSNSKMFDNNFAYQHYSRKNKFELTVMAKNSYAIKNAEFIPIILECI